VGLCELGAVDLQRARRSIDQAVVQHQSDSGLTALLTRRFEGGVELSGGQWQRIALARAFYSLDAGRDVLIMDEPTASLDARSELRLFDSLLRETKGATVIFLSHRFSTVRKADRIVVLEGGRIQEDGSHDELMAYGGRYATMFQAQAASFKEDLGGGS
jgi:ATP-binding cassette subfamily B protein